MFKIKLKSVEAYSEEGQVNPLRWMILSKQGNEVYQQESAWLKCKDFFNDLAYTIQTGKKFSIYGFNAGEMNPPKPGEPVYMLLKKLTPEWHSNLKVVNQWLKDSSIPELVVSEYKDDQYLIEFPPFYFTNVYNISLISLLLRVINCDIAYNSFAEIKKSPHLEGGDRHKWDTVVAKNIFFAIPDKLKEFVWYCGPVHNSKSKAEFRNLSGLVHNNGVVSWSGFM